MTKPELLKALGWDDKLIAAFQKDASEFPDFAQVDLEFEPVETTTTEISLRFDSSILQTGLIISAR